MSAGRSKAADGSHPSIRALQALRYRASADGDSVHGAVLPVRP